MELIKQFFSNPWFGGITTLLSILLAIGFGIFSVVISHKQKKQKSLTYCVRNFNFIHDNINQLPKLQVHYQGFGEPITSLSVAKIKLWNSGNLTITKSQVIAVDPIKIHIKEGCRILEAQIIETKNEKNGLSISLNQGKDELSVKFEFINPGEGVIIQVIHTGNWSSDFRMSGTIIDALPVRYYDPSMWTFRKGTTDRNLAVFAGSVGAISFTIGYIMYEILTGQIFWTFFGVVNTFFGALISGFAGGAGCAMFVLVAYHHTIPYRITKFDAFEE